MHVIVIVYSESKSSTKKEQDSKSLRLSGPLVIRTAAQSPKPQPLSCCLYTIFFHPGFLHNGSTGFSIPTIKAGPLN